MHAYCNISNNEDGVSLYVSSNNNLISNCTISSNDFGVHIRKTSNKNIIFHNNFLNNCQNGYDICTNQWDNGNEGNYWDDYKGEDINNDGIGDTDYNIGWLNNDNYPLVQPFNKDGTESTTNKINEHEVPDIVYLLLIIVIILLSLIFTINYWYPKKK